MFRFSDPRPVETELVRGMAACIAHRGPDHLGIYISDCRTVGLGHARLSIIDLSADGHQPMANDRGSLQLVYNGEIYNHRELRSRLEDSGHRFRSATDTECILRLYEELGEGCLARLDGMFAFGLWDADDQSLWLARDRLGVKPLYYVLIGGQLVFGSEIKAVLKAGAVVPTLDEEALYDFSTFSAAPLDSTLFSGIRKLRPGTHVRIRRDGSVTVKSYWSPFPPAEVEPIARRADAVQAVRNTLNDAVRKRMMADVPVGAFLSGGVDSSSVVTTMAEYVRGPFHTFSVGFEGEERGEFNELNHAREVADMVGTTHHEVVIGHRHLLDVLPRMIEHLDEPVASPVCVPQWYVSRAAREAQVPVVQVGEGSDEIFFGYEFYLGHLWSTTEGRLARLASLPRFVRGTVGATVLPALVAASRGLGREFHRHEFLRRYAHGSEDLFWGKTGAFTEVAKELLFTRQFRRRVRRTDGVVRALHDEGERTQPSITPMQAIIYFELKNRLAEELLMRVDKMSMAWAIEARVPFLDQKLVELAFRIPDRFKLEPELKGVLREAMADVLPPSILSRPKVGFGAPIERWFREPSVREYVRAAVLPSPMVTRGIWRERHVEDLLTRHQQGSANFSYKLWNLMTAALWYRRWVEGESIA